ncbi:PorV/PorQ family protein [bacterium]|nr:PorV/PorQ family protein [bacterium]
MKSFKFIIFILITSLSLAFASTGDNAGHGGSYLRMGLGARALGMGNSGVADSENGFAAYYNPAGLSYLSERHLSLTYYFLSLDRQLHYVGIALPLKPSAGISIAWMHAGVSDIRGRNFSGEPDEVYETGENAIILSFSNAFNRRFSVGLNFKILSHNMLGITGSGLGFDIGVMIKPFDRFIVGVQLKDIGASYNWNTQELFSEKGGNYTDVFPQILKIGVAYKQNNAFTFSGDVEISDKNDYRVHFGGEYLVSDILYIRMGMDNIHPTFGAGLAYGFIKNINTHIDYSALIGLAGEGSTHVFSWEFKF